MAEFLKGKGISKSEIAEDGITACIRYGELYTHYNEVIDEVKSRTNVDDRDLVFSEANDVIIPSSGETQLDIATASCVIKAGIALGGDLNIIRTPANGIFLSFCLNSKKKKEIARLAQGISVVHLYSSQLAALSISFPSLNEQNKIASFLALIDKRIATQNKIIEKLESLIRAIKVELLSGTLRLKSEKGQPFPDWKTMSISEIAIKKSSSIAANSLDGQTGNFKIYGANGVLKKISYYIEEDEYISIVKDGAGVGRLWYCDAQSSVLGTLDIIKCKPNVDLKFLYYLLGIIDYTKYTTGSTIPHIYFKDYSIESFNVPCKEEQIMIGKALSKMDERISIARSIADCYRFQKQYFLNHLFI